MQRLIASGILVIVLYAVVLIIGTAIAAPFVFSDFSSSFLPEQYAQLYGGITGNWQEYGQLFTRLQSNVFWKIYLGIIALVPTVFLLHYVIVGAKEFSHEEPYIRFFSAFAIIVHWITATSFVLCALTGLMMIFGDVLGGGSVIRAARYVHISSALVFVIPGLLMFLIWVKDMFPAPHDIQWLFILGGYLSKEKKPIPAGKYNAGQKTWFWLATLGGMGMAYTGYTIWGMSDDLDTVRLFAIIHNILGMAIVAFLLTHIYMSLFAIKGAIRSMLTGYKPKDEVDTLHSRYKYE